MQADFRRYHKAEDQPARPAAAPTQTGKFVEYPDLTINLTNYSVLYMGHPVEMPPKELELLYFLASSPNQVFTREQLILRIFNEEYIGNDRIIDAHVKNLRKKLPMNLIKTVIGVGYQYALPGEKDGRN